MSKYGYIRVSTKDQNPDRQIEALLRYGIGAEEIFIDKVSGKDFERPAYRELVNRLQAGDIFVVKSIDRLGRNYGEILEEWRMLVREKCVEVEVVDMPLLNTNQGVEGLTRKFIADLVLQILAYVAETERSFIRQRQAEGIAVARAKGVRFGCPRRPVTDDFAAAYACWRDGRLSLRAAAKTAGMSYGTFNRRCKELMQTEETKEI